MHVDGQRAWLADGRIELIRIPGSSGGQYLAIHPITNALYREFLKAMPEVSPPPTWARTSWIEDNIPVTGITWYEALACAIWYGGKLPTEASWYWAALGGAQHRRYATVDGSLTDQTAHFGVAFGEGMPVPTGTYQATEEGFDGLCGNTWDWCSDIDGPFRSIRGGGWMDDETFCRTDSRYRHAPIDRDACVGVRLALDVSDVVC
jgi:formylglycine-generating enzyme required for sulfatase activity